MDFCSRWEGHSEKQHSGIEGLLVSHKALSIPLDSGGLKLFGNPRFGAARFILEIACHHRQIPALLTFFCFALGFMAPLYLQQMGAEGNL